MGPRSTRPLFCGWRSMAERGAVEDWGGAETGPAASWLPRLSRASALRDSMLLVVLAAVWIVLYFATGGTFLTQRNLVLLALQTSIVSLAAISAVMLIVTRNFDLSVGSAVALVGVVLALLTVKADVTPLLAVLAASAAGLAMGAWQGWWVTRIGVSSFIVTLAGMLYFRGISMIRAGAPGVSGRPQANVGRVLVPPVVAAAAALWVASWQGIPYLALLVAICTF